jgi:hypothetical protein
MRIPDPDDARVETVTAALIHLMTHYAASPAAESRGPVHY